ncbi:hypothetical protein PAAG_04169 [Paracoccidioides lutzii Pb01]|uniref:Uncharacterized protein n=1 Tax=Paracoccidioides lutzii (strain ATCC MYA-826 / Pb01) TaxID=502779 RepID=C1H075_PARBA|nr:hypothetical protein PAAG_04169 [Paracoccidioides lutzii Pb01]EEH33116.2 hypothetical protein PAAG_04169 [Paracoccidioides lutzii Pb01]
MGSSLLTSAEKPEDARAPKMGPGSGWGFQARGAAEKRMQRQRIKAATLDGSTSAVLIFVGLQGPTIQILGSVE